jgi:hypothetical protein
MVKMDVQILDWGLELGETVQLSFRFSPVVSIQPIITEFGKIAGVCPVFPGTIVVRGVADGSALKLLPYGIQFALRDRNLKR